MTRESEVAQSCLTLCDPVDCSLPGSSVHGILQARILKWVAISFSRGSSRPRDQTQVSRTGGRCFGIQNCCGPETVICFLYFPPFLSIYCSYPLPVSLLYIDMCGKITYFQFPGSQNKRSIPKEPHLWDPGLCLWFCNKVRFWRVLKGSEYILHTEGVLTTVARGMTVLGCLLRWFLPQYTCSFKYNSHQTACSISLSLNDYLWWTASGKSDAMSVQV